ncbi:ribosomal-processing cysteine protease Prp [Companilactobacillus mishanensis]|uniref:Ribosomal processing cysteine protease Prp n=1 Tax=Companilactobacillus mishanensis TaxID=2486008 RepID=A0A5P0ZEI2_9LACO|nr:ribosomal-processing cysteine protease Prp [Companilactobacillus mishanensis]MQS44443.1 ribosomal-processing cysteine protease Prp [Companilactobacillus mishanensis]MQS51453.1 ribosomal-processing cysteine protease Prp [Companilactobacillus mishanensis]MQS88686.1 ribosomal-processing cysteine protease Prp [Companilactobacillus mishanensis]
MIKASFHRNDDNKIDSFLILGHADSGPYGQDLVCAAVSAVTIGTINNLEKLTKITPQVVLDEVNGGHLGCRITGTVSHDTGLLLENLSEILIDIEGSYPKNITVKNEKNTIEFD